MNTTDRLNRYKEMAGTIQEFTSTALKVLTSDEADALITKSVLVEKKDGNIVITAFGATLPQIKLAIKRHLIKEREEFNHHSHNGSAILK